MAGIRQTFALLRWNFLGIVRRLRGAAVVAIGFFAVILVFVAVLSVRDGIVRSGMRTGNDDIAIVTSDRKPLNNAALAAIGQLPGVAHDAAGPMAAATTAAPLLLRDWKPNLLGIAMVVGIEGRKTGVLPNFHIVAGRMFRSGLDEMIMGEGARRMYPAYAAGQTLEWEHRSWKVVGVYSTGSITRDSQFLADLHQVQGAARMQDMLTGIYVRLASPAAFDALRRALDRQPGLDAKVQRLSDEDHDFGSEFEKVLMLADGVITVLMAAGAIFAALNVMYANVASRSGELALLRALGFSRSPILAALLSEAVALALIGGALGVLAAMLFFDGLQTSSLIGGHAVAFDFAVTPAAVGVALGLTLGMGFVGGLFPAIRAARLPVARALREA
ncbi:MAG TPA: FtsX-like permease family protein [Rhizomicrobium sp.]|nr:FtsX-like permease family protein [Rhizomicrobium sp.]